jgi:glycosyltransferase involved in cell wall biosynthesis
MAIPHSKLKDVSFIVFSDDWGRHPSSCQHLFRRIAPYADVLWVNTVGLRTPRLSVYDLKRSLEVIGKWIVPAKATPVPVAVAAPEAAAPSAAPGSVAASAEPRVIRPPMVPFFQWDWAKKVNAILIRRGLDKALKDFAPGKRRILVSTLPIVPFLFKSDLFAKKVYYCVDDFTTWHGMSGETMRALENEMLPHADVLIATSSQLLEERGKGVPKARLLTHGVDADHFARPAARSQGAPKVDAAAATAKPVNPAVTMGPSAVPEALPKPVLGMFGAFDQRVDGNILRALARKWPQGTIAVVGPVDRDLSEFSAHPNIRFLGAVSYAELPARVSGFDVCILPYVVDESTARINPLKLKEYLATGKPVIATPLPEAVKLSAYLSIAEAAEFPAAVERALSAPGGNENKLRDFLAAESWEAKARTFCESILEDP